MTHSHSPRIDAFREQRDAYNQVLAKYANAEQKRFFGLDATTYQAGHLDKKTKELLGFVASLVLRCDDCILYHLIESHKAGVKSEELAEAVSIGMLVGGSITIPHVRRAMDIWDKELEGKN
ncbi:MAG: carboxymuconolactone decarboxylase family protein [Alphaproteobacteria bacterium]|nr:carboxymuconolactone decarboxylase family protein [Alphaproteobacteria bacterium]